jgi:MarR-like DNA-binding transcriptional regulator SgrR of sgrS sRNA
LDDSKYWKRTNEAILKISKRLTEINKKARKLANLKELAASSVKDKLVQLFNKAGIQITQQDIDYNQIGTDRYEFDIMLNGEPYGIDYNSGELTYQDYDKEVRLGNMNQELELIKTITQTFKP